VTRSQGTLGVITWANIMAEPLPLKQKIFFTAASSIEPLLGFTSRVQKKWLGYECLILNRANLACILAKKQDEIDSLQQQLPAFVQIFCIGGLTRFPDERIAWQEADFLETSQECGLTPKTVMPEAPRAARFFEKNLCRCFPGEVYWKDARQGASADIFFITTLDRVPVFIAEMQQQAASAGYNFQDIGMYVQPIENGRAAHLEFSLPYSRDDERARTRMRGLHEAAGRAMFTQGALFTRAYGSWAQLAHGCNAAQQQTARLIKELLDPNNIMNPGRLGL
jgi:FAD/FMN-containing dehydrogenase